MCEPVWRGPCGTHFFAGGAAAVVVVVCADTRAADRVEVCVVAVCVVVSQALSIIPAAMVIAVNNPFRSILKNIEELGPEQQL